MEKMKLIGNFIEANFIIITIVWVILMSICIISLKKAGIWRDLINATKVSLNEKIPFFIAVCAALLAYMLFYK